MRRFIFMSLGLLVLAFSLSGIGANQSCPSGWFSHNVSCYKFFSNWTTWGEAQRICMEEQEGAQLASIKDLEESVKLSDELSKTRNIFDVWIGLRFSKTKGIWLWNDGSQVTHTRWEEGEPSKKECAVLITRSRYLNWRTDTCRSWNMIVCKLQPQRQASGC
ncbi:C-type lectin lectoxin-Phi1-like [Erythrolamprus reginae]|uniref:C-type lectin lectoxin-Phi1-like n=1 Tax=Erythrolamprus reginae TaxID=121349 RepID=UPI00396C5EAB